MTADRPLDPRDRALAIAAIDRALQGTVVSRPGQPTLRGGIPVADAGSPGALVLAALAHFGFALERVAEPKPLEGPREPGGAGCSHIPPVQGQVLFAAAGGQGGPGGWGPPQPVQAAYVSGQPGGRGGSPT